MTKREKENYIKRLDQHTYNDLIDEIIMWAESAMKFEKETQDLKEKIINLENKIVHLEHHRSILDEYISELELKVCEEE